jgi:urea carboxylase
MLKKILIANRGEIACRIIRSCKKLGIPTVAIYSEADRYAPHVYMADEAFCVGPARVTESYLNAAKILGICSEHGVDAIHPGYGLLSENSHFAKACEEKNIHFVGPTASQIDQFGLKHKARELATAAGVPLLPGTGLLQSVDEALVKAEAIGYPVILKSVAGGGGIGMRVCEKADDLATAYEQVEHQSLVNFGQAGMYLEKFISHGRHVEVQIFGNGKGRIVTLGERDCSTQRRNQKVIEETPAPHISEKLRRNLADSARRLASSIYYRSAGTVEFLVNAGTDDFYFLEVNTRLQVEHGVTEEVTGVDIVEWMLRLAAGEDPTEGIDFVPCHGHSIQVRLYAEDPCKNFQPCSGTLTKVAFPKGIRCETWIASGTEVTPYYDPLLAKLIVKGRDRPDAVRRMLRALNETAVHGIETNLEYLKRIVGDDTFSTGRMTTTFLKSFRFRTTKIDVISSGTQTSIQDYPGRLGYWDIGVPPSGPMDHLAFRIANRLVGNAEGTAALEMTLVGPTLKFNADTRIAVTGAPIDATLDGEPVKAWQSFIVKAGSILRLGDIAENGCRAYLAVEGGFDVPDYLGSKSTFVLGHFGGHGGRALLPGDVLHLNKQTPPSSKKEARLDASFIPSCMNSWEIRVTYGPHGAPDFFTEEDIDTFLGSTFEVHYNSARTGIRLIAPHKPKWARKDGGEAGLHPSNLHDTAYAVGSINFTGDMPIILGPDGPSLGGFVCPVTIIQADMWMIGQLRPGHKVHFTCVSQSEAAELEKSQDKGVKTLRGPVVIPSHKSNSSRGSCVLESLSDKENPMAVTYRSCGDHYVMIEYGPIVLDLNFRFRIYALMEWIRENPIKGLIDMTPGVRSLQLHYDSRVIPQSALLERMIAAEKELPAVEDMVVPTRVIRLPMSWDNEAVQTAVKKYGRSVRKDAPWCPSNIEFIRRINGLESTEEVRRIVFDASYLVMGLGDVYLGAPAAVPVDPRHRLLTTKYNPARTWTAEGTVGIGGVYMCIYGMDSPGGYQLVGQTLPIWNSYLTNKSFKDEKPWLLRFFDQVRFYPVKEDELVQMRRDFLAGKYEIKIETEDFSLRNYNQFLMDNAASIQKFQTRQRRAFGEERNRWAAAGQKTIDEPMEAPEPEKISIPKGHQVVASHINGNVWKILVKPGDVVKAGQNILILEAMKMEISIQATVSGRVSFLFIEEGIQVRSGQQLAAIDPALLPLTQAASVL